MTRSFRDLPVDEEVLVECVDLATWAPSAGKTQGWHVVALAGPRTALFWDATLPAERREGFAWPGLLRAPVILVVCAEPEAYLRRYSEADKAAGGLGSDARAWPTPYWTVDASFAAMTMLLAFEDAGLGALFFGVFRGIDKVRADLEIPDDVEIIGAIAVGHPDDSEVRPGRSASRPRRRGSERIRWAGTN